MNRDPKVLVVIVNYNGKDLLEKHLHTIVNSKYPNLDIVVVDNNSVDESLNYLKENYPEVHTIKSEKNLGFGRANNLATEKYPNYDYYLFINNDLDITANTIEQLVSVAQEDKKVGAVGPKILYSSKRDGKYIINSAGIEIKNNYSGYDRYEGEEDSEIYNKVEQVQALCGACLLVRSDIFNKIGGFDKRMFLYYEDVDLCLRIHDLGYNCMYNGNAVVYHDHMASTKKLSNWRHDSWSLINKVRSIQRRKGLLIAIKVFISSLVNFIIWKLFTSRKGITFTQHNNNVYKTK